MTSGPQGKRRGGLVFVALIVAVVAAMLVVSGVVERLAPPGEPLWYLAGAGIVVGLLAGGVAAAVRKRRR